MLTHKLKGESGSQTTQQGDGLGNRLLNHLLELYVRNDDGQVYNESLSHELKGESGPQITQQGDELGDRLLNELLGVRGPRNASAVRPFNDEPPDEKADGVSSLGSSSRPFTANCPPQLPSVAPLVDNPNLSVHSNDCLHEMASVIAGHECAPMYNSVFERHFADMALAI